MIEDNLPVDKFYFVADVARMTGLKPEQISWLKRCKVVEPARQMVGKSYSARTFVSIYSPGEILTILEAKRLNETEGVPFKHMYGLKCPYPRIDSPQL